MRSFACCMILAAALAGNLPAQKAQGRAAPNTPVAPGQQRKGNRNIVDKWNRMPPAERDKALSKLPPGQRDKIQQQLNRYNNLTPEQRRQLRTFNQLPPEKQNQARRLYRQFNEFPQERQGVLKQEFESLRTMPEADRQTRLQSD